MEVRGFEPRASRMQSERSTTELHPLVDITQEKKTSKLFRRIPNFTNPQKVCGIDPENLRDKYGGNKPIIC